MSDPWAEFVTQQSKIGLPEDIALSGGTGLNQGAAQLMGFPGDIVAFGKNATSKVTGAAESRGFLPKGTSELVSKAFDHGMPGPVGDAARAARTAMATALRAGGASPDVATGAANLLPGGGSLPTTKDIEDALGARKSYHKPQTVAGEYTRTLGQFAPGALMPGSWATKAANVVVPALTSETAGQLTKGSDIEPYARIAGALLGAGGVAAATQPRPTTRMLADASRGATDDQLRLAQALREDAAGRGVTLTQAEAIQQVTNNGTGLGELQRVLEATRGGSRSLSPVMAQRPEQVRQAVTQFADNVAPPTADPYMLGQQAQGAAGDVLTGVRQQINANARPFYDALAGERMPAAAPAYQELVQSPAYAEALGNVRNNPILNGPIAQLPDDSLAVVNEVVKQLDTLAQNAAPNPATSTGSAQLSSAYEAARNSADELASATSEPWRLSRAMVSSGREAFLEPLQAGPMGAMSRTGDVQAQTRALFPAAPPEGAAGSTEMTMSMLPQETAAPLARQHLMNGFNEASQNLQSGPNQWGGAKFAATVAGNPEQRQVLAAGVDAAAPGQGAELERLLQALEATGKRQAQGSKTAYNIEELRTLGEPGFGGQVLSTGLNPPGVFRRLGEGFKQFNMERNSNQLAEALVADPARANEIMMEARRTLPQGAQLDVLERLAIAVGQGRQRELPPPTRP